MADKPKTKRQIAAEIKEVDRELKNYDTNNASIENNILTIERKKTRLLNVLNANRSRYASILKDIKKSARELKKANKMTRKAEIKNQSAKASVQKQKKEVNSLKVSMADQIQSVTQNIEKLNLSTSDWEREQLKSLQQCEDAKEIALKSFSRFTSISVPTQMWLSSEGHATKSMTAIADLQGLVGEWSALRSIAAEIQVISDSQETIDMNGNKVCNSGMIYLLKEKTDKRAKELSREGASLKIDITALEKERRHMHTLLCDLIYYLEEDSKHNTTRINAIVSQSIKSTVPDELEIDLKDFKPPKSALKKPTVGVTNNINLGEESMKQGSISRYHVSRGGNKTEKAVTYEDMKQSRAASASAPPPPMVSFERPGLDAVTEHPPATDDNPDIGHLTDKWLDNLDISNRCPLIKTIRHKLTNDGGRQEPTTLIAELRNKQEIENIRLGVTALETKIVWRSLQKVANNVAYEFCQKAKSEWDSFGSHNNSEYNANVNQAPETHHYGKCHFEQSDSLEPSVHTVESGHSLQAGSVSIANLRDCLGFYDNWQNHSLLMLQTSMATDSILPSAPTYMLNRAVSVVKKPKSRKNKSMYDVEQTGLLNILKARVEDIQRAKRAIEQRKEEFAAQSNVTHEHLLESGRKARQKERSVRIQMFQKKLVAKRITRASNFALMSEEMSRRMSELKPNNRKSLDGASGSNKDGNTRKESAGSGVPSSIIRPSDMTIEEDSNEDEDEESEEEEEEEEGSDESEDDTEDTDNDDDDDEDEIFGNPALDSRNQLLADIADKGIKSGSSSTYSMPMIGENSFIENGLSVQFEPKDPADKTTDAAKLYAALLERVEKDLKDQVVTQLTLKMGPETVSVVAYWQPLEDRLKIKMFCFHRNEEYTCYVDHEIVKVLFHKTNLLTNSAKIQSSYVIRNVIERMTIEHIPRSQALEMTMYLKSSYPNTCVAETPDSRDANMFDKRGKKKKRNQSTTEVESKEEKKPVKSKLSMMVSENFNESVFLAKALNNEEEDKLRVLTIRSVETNDVVVCSIAKVKTSNWEELLNALPLSHRSDASTAKKIVPTAPSLGSKSDKSSFGNRSSRIKK